MLKKFGLILFILVSVNCVFAQIGDGGLEPDPGNGQIPTGAVPVDAGLGFLLAGGIAYGAKKAYDYKKNKVKSEK